jgi:hypothetical protein
MEAVETSFEGTHVPQQTERKADRIKEELKFGIMDTIEENDEYGEDEHISAEIVEVARCISCKELCLCKNSIITEFVKRGDRFAVEVTMGAVCNKCSFTEYDVLN